jgi:cysteine desulfurase family protein
VTNSIYLDNAATSHPKPEMVYRAVEQTLRAGGSPGRGSHYQALAAERLVFETREMLAQLIGAESAEAIIFTPNATVALNQALFGLLQSGDRVVTTGMEHNAVMRPLKALQDRGVAVATVAGAPVSGLVEVAELKRACLAESTRMLVVNHCSNVSGALQEIEQLGPWCRQHDILFLVDAAQTAGSFPLDVQASAIDLLAAPGHKSLLGPQGTGFLYVRPGLELHPLIYGGTGGQSHNERQPVDLPQALESGTFNLPGLAGLNAALKFLHETGIKSIGEHEQQLITQLQQGLKKYSEVTLYGPDCGIQRGAVVSFSLGDRDPAEVGFFLDRQRGISTRVGLHCAPAAHRSLGTYPIGTVRVSPGYFTTPEEIDTFLQALDAFIGKAFSR